MTSEVRECRECSGSLVGRQRFYCSETCRNKYNGRKNYGTNGTYSAQRERLLRHRYGISHQDYLTILEFQNGACAICSKPDINEKRRHSVDHDHKSGIVRGILCVNCNARILGKLTLEQIEAARDYLRDPPAVRALGRSVVAPGRAPQKRRSRRARTRRR